MSTTGLEDMVTAVKTFDAEKPLTLPAQAACPLPPKGRKTLLEAVDS